MSEPRTSIDKPEHALDEERADVVPPVSKIAQQHADLYAEALAKYGIDGDIDPVLEKRLKRKLDFRIIPALGVCYFFYVSVTVAVHVETR